MSDQEFSNRRVTPLKQNPGPELEPLKIPLLVAGAVLLVLASLCYVDGGWGCGMHDDCDGTAPHRTYTVRTRTAMIPMLRCPPPMMLCAYISIDACPAPRDRGPRTAPARGTAGAARRAAGRASVACGGPQAARRAAHCALRRCAVVGLRGRGQPYSQKQKVGVSRRTAPPPPSPI
jgi:hypothetical protein